MIMISTITRRYILLKRVSTVLEHKEARHIILDTLVPFLVLALLVIGLDLVLMPNLARADTTLTVNSDADVVDKAPGDGVCATAGNVCTLRAAIQEANAFGGNDTIILPSGTYTLTIFQLNEDNATGGDLDITGNLTIKGAGKNTTIINGNSIDRIFHIIGTSTVSISNLTIRNGNTNITAPGGGIYNEDGSLTIHNCNLIQNIGLAIGGAIRSGGILSVTDSTFSNNQGSAGGAIDSGTTNISGSVFFGNASESSGGAIIVGGPLLLINSTIFSNTAPHGSGGGIYNTGTITVTSSTIYGNRAFDVGGIDNRGSAVLRNSIIGGNTDGNLDQRDCYGLLTSQGYNLIQTITLGCTIDGDPTGNLSGQDPSLGPLQDNGGPTFSLALLPTSPAIDAGSCGGLTTDQRGFFRPFDISTISNIDDGCDIGAYELGGTIFTYLPLISK